MAREREEDEARIKRVLTGLDVAWNAHDAPAFAESFCEDADFTNVRGMQVSGRRGVERFMAPLFATMFSGSEQRILRWSTRFLSPSLAAVDVWWTMRGARAVDGQDRPTRFGLFNLVMRKDAGDWRIAVWHNMELAGPPPEDPSAWRLVVFHNDGPAAPTPSGSPRLAGPTP
jgi:uncharacterized protein (TIGR02246 family)